MKNMCRSVTVLMVVFLVACGSNGTTPNDCRDGNHCQGIDGDDPSSGLGDDGMSDGGCTLLEETNGIDIARDISYGPGGGAHERMDVFTPQKEGPLPGLIMIHGGSWLMGSRTDMEELAQYYAKRGIVVFTVDYSLSTVSAPSWPTAIADLVCAVRHIRGSAGTYGLNPDLLAVLGHSAGGHLASLLGVLEGNESFLSGACGDSSTSSQVVLVIDLSGPTDLEMIGQGGNAPPYQDLYGPAEQFLGVPYAVDPSPWVAASPLTYLDSADPSFLVIHGQEDDLVPPLLSDSFVSALTAAQVDVSFVLIPGASHVFTPEEMDSAKCHMDSRLSTFLQLE